MAANFITHLSLVHPKPSLSAKSLQNPSLSHLSKLSPSSSVCFLPIKRSGVVGKLSFASAVAGSTSSIPEDKKISKNPIIVIDNYDSFTYNLCQENPRGVLISPGPGTPQDSGISLQTVLELGPIVPLFGVCMGLQCIGEAFGGKIIRSPYGVMHGKSSLVYHDEKGEDGLLAGLSNPFNAGRYHSLVIERTLFPGKHSRLLLGQRMDRLWLLGTKSISMFRAYSSIRRVS